MLGGQEPPTGQEPKPDHSAEPSQDDEVRAVDSERPFDATTSLVPPPRLKLPRVPYHNCGNGLVAPLAVDGSAIHLQHLVDSALECSGASAGSAPGYAGQVRLKALEYIRAAVVGLPQLEWASLAHMVPIQASTRRGQDAATEARRLLCVPDLLEDRMRDGGPFLAEAGSLAGTLCTSRERELASDFLCHRRLQQCWLAALHH